ncbi:MAG: hypothetical protein WD826_10305, partial [Actinomycetota bacterium]
MAYVGATMALACAFAAVVFARRGLPDWREFAFFWTLHLLTRLDRIDVPIERLSLVKDGRPRGVKLSPGFVVLISTWPVNSSAPGS